MSSLLFASMEQILDRFDEAWNDSTPPHIEDHLALGDPNQRLALLIELIRIDMERRLASGERVRLEETYPPQRFPELHADSSAIIMLVKHEFELRRRNEPDLMLAEYLQRFAQFQTELLAQLPTLDDSRDGERQQTKADATVGLDLRGYELSEALGRGGMGEVYRCCDPALGRDLAIKVMMAPHRGHPERERRFLREARITGSLQHPGIVSVHNLGRLNDGRLHYTMRLVRGRTFADILKDEAGKQEHLPDLLTIYEKICQAVAYAHSKRVIHRDLKPHNVMVGRFGEVQLMDWGLAKVLTLDDASAESEETTDAVGTRIFTESADTPVELSRMGVGLGTLPYMPSEQARGKWDTVDERADVFALGSILCEILTGQPAYGGTSVSELCDRAERGDVTEALERLQRCGADATLTALCGGCLSPLREGRPRDAAAVAERVQKHQADVQERLRQAEIERAEAQLKAREARKQRHLLIALILALLVGSALSTWQAVRATIADTKARDNERQALAERDDKEVALGKAKEAAEAERKARNAEALQREKAQQSEADTKAVLGFFQDKVLSAGRPEGQNGGLGNKVTLRKAVDAAKLEIAKSFVDRPLVEASIRDTLGTTYLYLGDYPQAMQQHERASALRETKLGLDHRDTLASRNNLAEAFRSAGRTADAVRLYEQNLKLSEAKLGIDHPDTLVFRGNLAVAYSSCDRIGEAIGLQERTLKQMETKFGPDYPSTLGARNNLAETYRNAGRTGNAVRLHEQNLKLSEVTLGIDHPNTLTFRNNLSVAYGSDGRTADVIHLRKHTLEQMEAKLGADHPETLNSRNNLAEAYKSAGRTSDAVHLHEQNLKLSEVRLGTDHPRTLSFRGNLAVAYWFDGKLDRCIPLLKMTLKQREAKLGADHSHTLQTMVDLGVAYSRSDRAKDAIPLLEEVLKRGHKRSSGLPAQLIWVQGYLPQTYERAGEFAKAESIYRDSLEKTRQKFGSEDTRTAEQMYLLGRNLLLQQKYANAEPFLRDCHKVREGKQPDDWTTFNTRSLLGAALLGQKKYAEAEPLLLQGYEGMKAREAKIPPAGKVRLTEALERPVKLYEAMDKKDEAAKWRKLLDERNVAQKKSKS